MARSQQTCSNTGEMSHEQRQLHRMQVVFARNMQERRVFLDELTAVRRKREKRTLQYIIRKIGPKWYQVLSVSQRQSLDSLESSISKDLVEGTPLRTLTVMKALGLYPTPNKIDLMNCMYFARDDPKKMLAELYLVTFGNHFYLIESEYCLNAKLILSGIYYLGQNSLIQLLTERFKPEPEKKKSVVKRESKIIKTPAISPYLEHMTAVFYEPPKKKRAQPAPLPNLDDLNEPFEPKPCKPKLPPPPPPPPPPKKRIPRSYCEKMAGIMTIQPYSPVTSVNVQHKGRSVVRSSRKHTKMYLIPDEKKSYGGGINSASRKARFKKPVAPTTAMSNTQFMISGVFRINGKHVYVLGNITTLPPAGDLLHCGHKCIQGENVIIHGGYKGHDDEPIPAFCDCLKKWAGTVYSYVRRTKCYCGHNYDYGNEGSFSKDELAFFKKPTRYAPPHFNLETIFSMDPKTNYVQKKFKKLWETDSILNDGKGEKTTKSKVKSSTYCLGENPKPEDYLRCALRYMQDENIAAKLPNIHLAPELKEWMHRRIYGQYSPAEKKAWIQKSTELWKLLDVVTKKGLGRVRMPKEPAFKGMTNWCHKAELNVKFRKYTQLYRYQLYEAQANVANMFWRTMYQDKFPDKNFRDVFFSYVFTKIDDVQLIHPYTERETVMRYLEIIAKRYCCISEFEQRLKD